MEIALYIFVLLAIAAVFISGVGMLLDWFDEDFDDQSAIDAELNNDPNSPR